VDGEGGGGTFPGADGCNCSVSSTFDLTPLQGDHGLADKFPFGIFTWTKNALTTWSAQGEAPVFSIPLYGDHNLVVDFAALDPALVIVRPVLVIGSFLLLMWTLATGMLGIGSGGGGGDE
jgi:hypothetical protein